MCCRSFYLPEGWVETVEGVEKLDEDPDVLVHSLHKIHLGKNGVKNLDKTSRFTIVLKAESTCALKEKIAWAQKTVNIQVRCGNRLTGTICQ